MKLNVVKTNIGTLVPAFDTDHETFKKMSVGDVMEMEWKKPRNPLFHRKFFALIRTVYSNTERFPNQNACRLWLTMKAGFVDYVENDGELTAIPKSIAFHSMDELKFEQLYNAVVDVAINELNFPKQIVDEVANYY